MPKIDKLNKKMLLMVGSALGLMFLTPFVAMFCLQIIKPWM